MHHELDLRIEVRDEIRGLIGANHEAFGLTRCDRSDAREHRAVLEEPAIEVLVALDDLADEPEFERFARRHHALLEHEAHCAFVSDGARECPREAQVGGEADPRVPGVEARRRCRDADVGVHRERDACADGNTIHPRQDRLLTLDAHDDSEVWPSAVS